MVTDHQHGGYDMDDNEIGIFLSISSFASVLYQVNHSAIPHSLLQYSYNNIVSKQINTHYAYMGMHNRVKTA